MVPAGMRSKSKLEAAIQARKLAAYTIEITGNEKKFPPEMREVLGKNYAELATLGMKLHPKKTKIIPITQEFKFLGFIYRITKTGKILMFVNPQTVKEERQRLRKMAKLVKKGRMTREKYEECYQCWRAHALKGSSREMIKRMDAFKKGLLET